MTRSLPLAAAAPRAAARVSTVLLILHEIFGETTEDSTTKRSKDAVVSLLAEVMACEATAEGAEKTSV